MGKNRIYNNDILLIAYIHYTYYISARRTNCIVNYSILLYTIVAYYSCSLLLLLLL